MSDNLAFSIGKQAGSLYLNSVTPSLFSLGPMTLGIGTVLGVFLSLIPVFDKNIFDDDVVEKFKIHLINQTKLEYTFTYIMLYMKCVCKIEYNFISGK